MKSIKIKTIVNSSKTSINLTITFTINTVDTIDKIDTPLMFKIFLKQFQKECRVFLSNQTIFVAEIMFFFGEQDYMYAHVL